MRIWAFFGETHNYETTEWICDSRAVAEAFARRWVADGWALLRFSAAPPEDLRTAFRALAEADWYGRVEEHVVATRADFDSAFP